MARMTTAWVVGLLVAAGAARGVAGQDADPNGNRGAGADGNAAAAYREAIARYQDLRARFDGDAWEALDRFAAGRDTRLSAEAAALLRAARPALDAFQDGAARPACDFALNHEDGPMMLLPHLAPMRGLGSIATAEARRRLDTGDARGATELFAATARASTHLASDRTLISGLVGMSIASRGIGEGVANALDRGLIPPSEATRLLEAAATLDDRDPFGVVEALRLEGATMADWIGSRLHDPNAMADLATLTGGDEAIVTMTPAEFDLALAGYEVAMEDLSAALGEEDPAAAREHVAEVEAAFERGEYGPIASSLAPAVSKVFESMERTRARLDEVRARLERVASGPEGREAEMNAAAWYVRAIDRLRAAEPGARDAAADPGAGRPPGEAGETLGEAIDLARKAAQITRCDFEPTRRDLLELASGMVELQRILLAEARRTVAETSTAETGPARATRAAELLADAILMSAHLAEQETIPTSMLAQAMFERARQAAANLDLADAADAASERVQAAAARHEAGDPFRYGVAIGRARRTVASWIDDRAPDDAARAMADAARDWSPGDVFVAWMLRPGAPNGRASGAGSERIDARDLEPAGVALDWDAIAALAAERDAFERAVREGRVEALEMRAKPQPGELQRWRARARVGLGE